jgi:DNA-binding beta-propeller fold protein YncE
MRAWGPPLLLLLGCREAAQPVCPDLLPDQAFPNHIQPFEVALDPAARLLYVTALGTPTVAIVDVDTAALIGMIPLGGSAVTRPDLAVDADGRVWVIGEKGFGAVRVDRGTQDRHETGLLVEGDSVLAVPGGDTLISGQAGRELGGFSGPVLVGVDAAGQAGAGVQLEATAPAIFALDGGARVGVLLRTGVLEVRDAATLALEERCGLDFVAQRGAQLDGGAIVVADDTHLGVATCRGVEGWTARVGVENKDVIALGDHALVLDRIGAGAWNPNLGVAWRVSAEGVEDRPAFATAKNTGYGALDPETGLLWVNSEGTGEVWAIDPDSGEVAARVRTGLFVDGLALAPGVAGRRYVTGRLTDALLRIDDGALDLDRSDAVRWPWAPVVDAERGLLWVLSQTTGVVHAFDLAGLEWQQSIDPQLDDNALLTFSGLGLDPDSGHLWLADSASDTLLELSPDTGRALRRRALGGPPITDPDAIGELTVLPDGEGGVLVARSNDGRALRYLPEHDELWSGGVEKEALDGVSEVDFARLDADRRVLWLGGAAVDALTLERRADEDLDVERVIGPDPDGSGALLVVTRDHLHLARLDAQGAETGRVDFAGRELHASVLRVDPLLDEVVMTRAQAATVCGFPIADLR